jgi:hypothetical protein
MFGRKPSLLTIGTVVVVELALLVQLVTTVVLVVVGQTSRGDIVEFFGYVLVAMLVPAGAVFWALVERSATSTMVLAVAGLTVAVMAYRMAQIWGLVP